jgi:hypothetical protein
MPRIDDYIKARKIAVEALSKEPFDLILKTSGFASTRENTFEVAFLNRKYRVAYPGFEFEDQTKAGQEIPLQEQILILHYLLSAGSRALAGRWISYREIPGASFYFSAFVKRAIEPLKKVFGCNGPALAKAAEPLRGKAIDAGDVGFEFDVLPKVPLQLIVYTGDEEFPAEANILFDENIGHILSPEDVAWLAGMLVYRLISISKNNQVNPVDPV